MISKNALVCIILIFSVSAWGDCVPQTVSPSTPLTPDIVAALAAAEPHEGTYTWAHYCSQFLDPNTQELFEDLAGSNLNAEFLKQHPKITRTEAEAIYDYTHADYRCFNTALRDRGYKLQVMETAIDVLNGALNKLPNYVGTVERGSTSYPALKDYLPGQVVTFPSYVSTSARQKIDQNLGYGGNYEALPIQFVIHSKAGKWIAADSAWGMSEAEVLFLPGTKFKILSRKDSADGKTLIEMEEANP